MGYFESYLKQQKPASCKKALRGFCSKSEPYKLYLRLSATKLVLGIHIPLPFLRCCDKPEYQGRIEGINPHSEVLHTSSSMGYGGSGFGFAEPSQ